MLRHGNESSTVVSGASQSHSCVIEGCLRVVWSASLFLQHLTVYWPLPQLALLVVVCGGSSWCLGPWVHLIVFFVDVIGHS